MTNKPHGKDLRKGRVSQPGGIYLITFATECRVPWFKDWALGRLVVASMRRAQEQQLVQSLAFVVMPDHVHWLIELENTLLQTVMREVKGHSGFYVKKSIRQTGERVPSAVWQEGYHDHALRSEESLIDVARYVVMNPVRAGLVRSVLEYPLCDAKWI